MVHGGSEHVSAPPTADTCECGNPELELLLLCMLDPVGPPLPLDGFIEAVNFGLVN